MFPALGQRLPSHLSPQGVQSVQLLIEQFRAAHSGLRKLAQPVLPITRRIDLGAGTGNALQLARASVLSRDQAKAKSAYQDFLTLWKDADRDPSILKLAQAEYADLN
jgi:hypothetical protein